MGEQHTCQWGPHKNQQSSSFGSISNGCSPLKPKKLLITQVCPCVQCISGIRFGQFTQTASLQTKTGLPLNTVDEHDVALVDMY